MEYNKIIERLTDKATSEQGRKLTAALEPMTDLEAIRKAQTETADALGYLLRGSTSFGGNKDLGMCIRSLEIGSTLSIAELLRIAAFLGERQPHQEVTGARKRRITACRFSDEYFRESGALTPLSNEIRRCILSERRLPRCQRRP